jgi:hypothetical protein
MKDRRVKQVFSRSGYQCEGVGKRKGQMRVNMVDGCILYSYMKIEE